MTPPPVVEILRRVASQLAGTRRTWDAIADHDVYAPALAALADSLSEITPERVEEVLMLVAAQEARCTVEKTKCWNCAERRALLAALSRISSGEAK